VSSESNPRFIITGSQGFIGRSLYAFLSKLYPVLGVSRSPSNSSQLSCSYDFLFSPDSLSFLKAFRPTHLIHCAALAHKSYPKSADALATLYDVNVNLPLELARFSDSVGISQYIFLSSIGVHGVRSLGSPITEDSLLCPANPYSSSKLLAENTLRKYFSSSTCSLSVIRPTLVYGKSSVGNLSLLLKAIDISFPFPFGKVHNLRSFLYLGNLISAIEAISFHPAAKNETFVLSDSESISTPDLLRLIAQSRNRSLSLYPFPNSLLSICSTLPCLGLKFSQLSDDLVVDSSKIRSLLSWSQPYSQYHSMLDSFSLG
jgi:UDP-glucose 4-epimerase